MGDSRATKFDDLASAFLEPPGASTGVRTVPVGHRRFSEWPVIRPLRRVVRGIRDTVNYSVDAVSGRYDL